MEGSLFSKNVISMFSYYAKMLIKKENEIYTMNEAFKILKFAIKFELFNTVQKLQETQTFKTGTNTKRRLFAGNYNSLLLIAAKYGNIEMFKQICKVKVTKDFAIDIFSQSVYNFEMMLYIEKEFFMNGNGKRFIDVLSIDNEEDLYINTVCEEASKLKDLKCLKYLHEAGYEWDIKCYKSAIEFHNIEIMYYLKENDLNINELSTDLINCCVVSNNIKAMKFLRDEGINKNILNNKYPWDIQQEIYEEKENNLTIAIKMGYNDIINYMISNDCPIELDSLYEAIDNDNLNVLNIILNKIGNAIASDKQILMRSMWTQSKIVLEFFINKSVKLTTDEINEYYIKNKRNINGMHCKNPYTDMYDMNSLIGFKFLIELNLEFSDFNLNLLNNKSFRDYLFEFNKEKFDKIETFTNLKGVKIIKKKESKKKINKNKNPF